MGKWAVNVLLGADQWINAVLGGDPDETISSRAGKARREGKWWGRALCRFLDTLDPGHCTQAIEEDEGGASLT